MFGWSFLQLFLVLNIFIIGVLVTIAVQHARAHFRPELQKGAHGHIVTPQNGHLPPAVRERLIAEAEVKFQRVLEKSIAEMHQDLGKTAAELGKKLDHIGNDVVGKEMDRYQAELEQLRAKAEAAIGGAQNDITAHQEQLKAQMAEEIAAEKQKLVAQIDTKLADAVVSFLNDTLGHEVDLGAQSKYLVAMLDAHKEDFKRGAAE